MFKTLVATLIHLRRAVRSGIAGIRDEPFYRPAFHLVGGPWMRSLRCHGYSVFNFLMTGNTSRSVFSDGAASQVVSH
jgi:hypothetical protein